MGLDSVARRPKKVLWSVDGPAQGLEECHQRFDTLRGHVKERAKLNHRTARPRVAIVIDDLGQRGETTIVHVWGRKRDVAQARHFVSPDEDAGFVVPI